MNRIASPAPSSAIAWLPLSRLTRMLESDPPFPASVVEGLALRGLTLGDAASAVLAELSCSGRVDHGDDDFAFLVCRVAGHAAWEAESAGRHASDARCLSDLLEAEAAGATLADVASSLSRPSQAPRVRVTGARP